MPLLLPGTNIRGGAPLRNQARNAYTRLLHAMRYQVVVAGGGSAGDFLAGINDGTELEEGKGGVEGKRKNRVPKGRVSGVGGVEKGQARLSFGGVGRGLGFE